MRHAHEGLISVKPRRNGGDMLFPGKETDMLKSGLIAVALVGILAGCASGGTGSSKSLRPAG